MTIRLADDVIRRDFGDEIVLLRLGDGAFFAIVDADAVRFRALLGEGVPDDALVAELLGEALIEPGPSPACSGRGALVRYGSTRDFSDVTPIRPGATALS